MLLNFYKNVAFTRLIKSADRLREYNFRRLRTSDDELFHVDVSDDRGNRIVFKMGRHTGGAWHILENALPAWITHSENQLNEALQDELQKLSVA